MKVLSLMILLLYSLSASYAASGLQHTVPDSVRVKAFSLKKQLMLQGYDVVSYQQPDGPRAGVKTYQAEYKGVRYYFVNAANRAAFLADPERYEPLYGGWCAYAMLEGDKTKANPQSYKIVDERLLVFYDGLWGDTLALWNEMEVSDALLIQQADRAWALILESGH